MRWANPILFAVFLGVCCPSQRVVADSPPPARKETIAAIKRVERVVGYSPTRNFHHADPEQEAYFLCYYTGKLELPKSYEDLKIKKGTPSGCPVNEKEYDVFFYKIEAVAGTETAVTEALEEAEIERFAVVVAHEDFHEDQGIQNFPTRIGEAATTLVGYLTAAQFAIEEYGPDSETYRNLVREADLYLAKARIVNDFHRRLSDLYHSVRKGKLSRKDGLKAKERLYREMQQACEAIEPAPSSFNRCLAANNNAGLAFEITYTRFYPLIHQLYEGLNRDLKRTVEELQQTGATSPKKEGRATEFLRRRIAELTDSSGS